MLPRYPPNYSTRSSSHAAAGTTRESKVDLPTVKVLDGPLTDLTPISSGIYYYHPWDDQKTRLSTMYSDA